MGYEVKIGAIRSMMMRRLHIKTGSSENHVRFIIKTRRL